MVTDRERWNRKYRTGEFDPPEEPSPFLREVADVLPAGRALDVATGAGRNALFLADRGYEVDAVDVSEEALAIARDRATERSLDVDWTRADLREHEFPAAAYDVVSVSFYHALGRLPDIKEALAPDGMLVYEHHLRSAAPVERGPGGDRYRFRSNDLLRACLDLTVLHYEEKTRTGDGRAAVATLLARNSAGGTQRYPER